MFETMTTFKWMELATFLGMISLGSLHFSDIACRFLVKLPSWVVIGFPVALATIDFAILWWYAPTNNDFSLGLALTAIAGMCAILGLRTAYEDGLRQNDRLGRL